MIMASEGDKDAITEAGNINKTPLTLTTSSISTQKSSKPNACTVPPFMFPPIYVCYLSPGDTNKTSQLPN